MHHIDGGPAPGTRVGILLAPPAIVITIDEYHSNLALGKWVSGPRRDNSSLHNLLYWVSRISCSIFVDVDRI